MSYDLYFHSRDKTARIPDHAFRQYFYNRPNYEVTEQQAVYSNEDTGVYFSFEYGSSPQSDTTKQEGEAEFQPVSFNMNYCRPHIFGLEAETELADFVLHFDLLVKDDQIGGMGEGEYSSSGFIKSWNSGNEFGYKAILKQQKKRPLSLPTKTIEQCWKWNYRVRSRQKELQADVFVPHIMLVMLEESVTPVVVWTDGIPITLPDVDAVVIYRQALAPRKLFSKKPDTALITRQQLEPYLARYPIQIEEGNISYRFLNYDRPPKDIANLIQGLTPVNEKLKGVSVDEILNQELVEKYAST